MIVYALTQILKTLNSDSGTLTSFTRDDLLVELLCKDEIGGGTSDCDEAANGSCICDAQRQTLADHVVPLGWVHGIPPDFGFLWHRNIN